ncbi:MAG: MarR family transcriptional regulator [Deltaproteobacteria bacterium]|nr:MarR family transcriptional regulator [Deltaproteobacteria bacterium]MBW2676006.1 MarR family transcriptional regulator [Deltaproteobacteria bacterium]
MDKLEECIIFQLAKAYQKAHGLFKKRLLPYGLTPIQHLILEALWMEDGLSQKDISTRLVLDKATLSGVLDRMSAGGWITKEQDLEDKRTLRICLTGKGKKLKPNLARERNQANDELLSSLNLEEKVLLKRLLKDVQS